MGIMGADEDYDQLNEQWMRETPYHILFYSVQKSFKELEKSHLGFLVRSFCVVRYH